MKPERILLPVDIRRCPLEVFSLVDGFSRRPEATLILLHVVELNIVAPDNRVDQELASEARSYLERVAEQYIHPITSTLFHVRFGDPAEQILQEALAEKAELIILPTYVPSFRDRLLWFWKPAVSRTVSPLAQRIIRDSSCGVFLASVKTRFNCEKAWGQPGKTNGRALAGSRAARDNRVFPSMFIGAHPWLK